MNQKQKNVIYCQDCVQARTRGLGRDLRLCLKQTLTLSFTAYQKKNLNKKSFLKQKTIQSLKVNAYLRVQTNHI